MVDNVTPDVRDEARCEPVITVLIDAYNYGRFIEQAIESVLSQDFAMEQVEILVVDDGSTDDTAERVKKYGGAIRYLRKENGGQASAFNLGFAEARGEFVFTLDADDYFLPGKLRRVMEEFEKHPELGMIYHRLMELDDKSGKLREARFAFSLISGFLPDDKEKLVAVQGASDVEPGVPTVGGGTADALAGIDADQCGRVYRAAGGAAGAGAGAR